MKVLVTGHHGYIGAVLVPFFLEQGHEVTGLDSFLFEGCTLGAEPLDVPHIRKDVREATVEDLRGFDAVVHLAAISNDPLGDLNPETTYEINYRASVSIARLARDAGVQRFLFSSSCSLYGAHGDDVLEEDASFNPVTPYGESKVYAERDIGALANDSFSPVFLRNATAYGVSPLLRGDLVVNNLVGYAVTTGEVLLKSDGTPWRPLVHIEDITRAFHSLMTAPRDVVHNEAFNVCRSEENYRISDVAEIVESVVPGSKVTLSENAGPDKRNYRVSGDKIARLVPDFQPQWTVRKGAEELYQSYLANNLTVEDLTGSRFQRIQRVRELQEAQRLDETLRWRVAQEETANV